MLFYYSLVTYRQIYICKWITARGKIKTTILDVACPFDTQIIQKENEKIEKYQDLKREIKRLWKVKTVSVVPIVIGVLGTISHRFQDWLAKGKIECPVEMLQVRSSALIHIYV